MGVIQRTDYQRMAQLLTGNFPITFGDSTRELVHSIRIHEQAIVAVIDYGNNIERSSEPVPKAGFGKEILDRSVRKIEFLSRLSRIN